MAVLDEEIGAFEAMRSTLEADHVGRWALVHDRSLVGTFDDFDSAASDAIQRFGRGPYLIRQVGADALVLPVSVMFNMQNA